MSTIKNLNSELDNQAGLMKSFLCQITDIHTNVRGAVVGGLPGLLKLWTTFDLLSNMSLTMCLSLSYNLLFSKYKS